MSRYSRYEDRDWESRMHYALRGRAGFAWGAFFLGFILGGIIFQEFDPWAFFPD